MAVLDLTTYPFEIAALWSSARLPDLGPGTPNESARSLLTALTPNTFPNVQDISAAKACISGLWLYHDFLDDSHTISQDLDEWYGSYWHAIMHRREPDASNSKYWFKRVPSNPVYELLADEGPYDPFRFVDQCECHRGTGTAVELSCRDWQLREMQLLFAWCYRQAVG